jgi:hypothetical protein
MEHASNEQSAQAENIASRCWHVPQTSVRRCRSSASSALQDVYRYLPDDAAYPIRFHKKSGELIRALLNILSAEAK